MQALPLGFAERLFFWSNALYVLGALLTLTAAAVLIYERRRSVDFVPFAAPMLRTSLLIAPACICLMGTIAAVCFSGVMLNQQRASVETYRLQAAMELSHLRREAEADRTAAQGDRGFYSLAGTETITASKTAGDPVSFEPAAGTAPDRVLGLDPTVTDTLRSFGGMRAVVESAQSDNEAAQFADHLLLLLIANGIDARQGQDASVLHQLSGQPGIHLRYRDTERGHDLAASLAQLLRTHGLHVDVAPSWDIATKLNVGVKGPAERDRTAKTQVARDQLLVSVGPRS